MQALNLVLVFIILWTSQNLCGICLYCKGGADMARKVNTIKKSGFAPIGVEPLFTYEGVQK